MTSATLARRYEALLQALAEHRLMLTLTSQQVGEIPADTYIIGSARHRNRVLAGIDGQSIADLLGRYLLFETPTAKVLSMRLASEFEMQAVKA